MKRLSSKWPQNSHKKAQKAHKRIALSFVLLAVCLPVAAQDKALKAVFKNDFRIGAALNRRQIFEEDTRGARIVSTHFNSITPENVLKWALVHPQPDRYDFAARSEERRVGKECRSRW